MTVLVQRKKSKTSKAQISLACKNSRKDTDTHRVQPEQANQISKGKVRGTEDTHCCDRPASEKEKQDGRKHKLAWHAETAEGTPTLKGYKRSKPLKLARAS